MLAAREGIQVERRAFIAGFGTAVVLPRVARAQQGTKRTRRVGALIGFAGPRVIEQTIRQKLPKGFQRSEFLLEHGMVDMVVDRREMRGTIVRMLDFMMNAAVKVAGF